MYQNIFVSYGTLTEPSMVYLWDDKLGLQTLSYDKFNYVYVLDDHGTMRSIYGDPVKKVHRKYTKNLSRDQVFELDIPKETRVLIDTYLHEDDVSTNHRICFFDIETRSDGGFPNIKTANKEITAITLYDTELAKYKSFILPPITELGKLNGIYTYPIKRTNDLPDLSVDVDIEFFVSEVELLSRFMEWLADRKYTILSGWNSNGFDIPYLYHRLRNRLGEDVANMISSIGIVRFNEYRNQYQIAGVSSLDYMIMFKKFTFGERSSYRLGNIGATEVNIDKVEYDGNLETLYENEFDKFINYSVQDVAILVELDKKLQYVNLVQTICHIGHVAYEDFTYSSKFIEGTILTYLHRKNVVASNKSETGKEEFATRLENDQEGFTGAYVKPPFPGLYKWIFSLDLQSLYPSIIMSLNISPETKIGKILDWDLIKYQQGENRVYSVRFIDDKIKTFSRTELESFIKEKNVSVSSLGVLYSLDKEGVIPEILSNWFQSRKEYKDKMMAASIAGDKVQEAYYDKRQHVQKILLNSIYGVLGLPIFRFYDIDNAESVTTTGKQFIKLSAKCINNKYVEMGASQKSEQWKQSYQKILNGVATVDEIASTDDHCIYIDTDSLYFSTVPIQSMISGDTDKEKCILFAKQCEQFLNEFYPILANKIFNIPPSRCRFVIKGEAISQSALWLAKKRYALMKVFDLEKNKDTLSYTYKGLDIVRASFPKLFKTFMENVLHMILQEKSKQFISTEILKFVDNLPNNDYIDVSVSKSVKKLSKYDNNSDSLISFITGTPYHVKAAFIYNRLLKMWNVESQHEPIREGDKIKLVYLRNNPFDINVIAYKGFNDPSQILNLIKEYIDHHAIYEHELENKFEKFYSALGWGTLPTHENQLATNFFEWT